MLERLRTAFRNFNDFAPEHRRLALAPEDLTLFSAKSSSEQWRVRWSQLEEIVAYKVDAITVDHLCLAFRQHGETAFHVIDEETPGWNSLLEELGNRFGVHHDAWFTKVAFPPFAENWIVLWRAAQLGAAPDVARNSAGPGC
jgi:hypothetical protein